MPAIGTGVGLTFSPPTFRPTFLPGCVLWLRADRGITLNGSDVSSWDDQSGAGNHLSQGTASKQPAFTASGGPNGRPGVDFDGVDETLTHVGSISAATDYTVACVLEQRGVATDQQLFSSSANHNLCENSQESTGDKLAYFSSGTGRVYFGTATNGSQSLIWRMVGTTVQAYKNGVQSGTDQTRSAEAYATQVWLSSNQDLGGWMNAIVSEFVVYSRALAVAEIARLHTYFSARYALP